MEVQYKQVRQSLRPNSDNRFGWQIRMTDSDGTLHLHECTKSNNIHLCFNPLLPEEIIFLNNGKAIIKIISNVKAYMYNDQELK